ncbi:hypothetical protein E4U09_006866, partial [Claviceps aff. purpurea]
SAGATDEAVPVGNDSETRGLVQSRHPKPTLTELPWVPSARLMVLWEVCRPMLDAKVGRTRSATDDEQCNKDKDCLTVQTLDNSIEKAVQEVLRTLSPAKGLRGRLSLLEAPPARYCTVFDL